MSDDIAFDASIQGAAGHARTRRPLLLASLFGLFGAALMVLYMRRFEVEQSGGVKVEVLSVLRRVERGALLTEKELGTSAVPMAYLDQRAIRASERNKILGVRTANALDPQDGLLWTDLALSVEQRDLSALIQPGRRAVTVQADESGRAPSGAGLIRPGDYVDVLATLRDVTPGGSASRAVVLLQRVLVLAVGGDTDPRAMDESKDSYGQHADAQSRLTFSLRLEDAQLLSLARERAVLSVALRNPDDTRTMEGLADLPATSLSDPALRAARAAPAKREDLPVRITDDH